MNGQDKVIIQRSTNLENVLWGCVGIILGLSQANRPVDTVYQQTALSFWEWLREGIEKQWFTDHQVCACGPED